MWRDKFEEQYPSSLRGQEAKKLDERRSCLDKFPTDADHLNANRQELNDKITVADRVHAVLAD